MMTMTRLMSTLFVVLTVCAKASPDSLPKEWRRALVSIEVSIPPQNRALGTSAFQEVGTGFWMTTDDRPPYRGILFTADHVFRGVCDSGIEEVQLRPDSTPTTQDSDVRRYPLKICDRRIVTQNIEMVPRWAKHPVVDLAAIIPPFDAAKPNLDILPFPSSLLPTEDDIQKWNISEGDDVLALAYYPNVSNERPSDAIVRQGVIAEFRERSNTFLVSLLAFPGNSGAPILLKQSGMHLAGGAVFGSVNPQYLMGVIVEYIPYQEVAISPQTKRPRVMFEENSGLARVVSSGRIRELLSQMSTLLPRQP